VTPIRPQGRFPHLPDGAVYAVVILALVFAALSRREHADAPPAPPALSREEGRPLPAAGAFHGPLVKVSADPAGPQSGTAFSVSPEGLWLTARHVVAGCARIAIMEAPHRAAEAQLLGPAAGAADVAVLKTIGGAPALPLAAGEGLRIGERGFHPGFPGGRPGETTSRLLGRQTLEFRARTATGGRLTRLEPVLSWAEAGRSVGAPGDLAGLSGAPVLDGRGRVVGVTLAEAPRRGRIYAAPVDAAELALRAAGLNASAPVSAAHPLNVSSYGRASDALRETLSVARVVCLDGA